SDVAIACCIKSNRESIIIEITSSRLVRPQDLARAVVLGDENIVTAGAREHDITEDSHIMERSRHITITRRIHRDASAKVIKSASRLDRPAEWWRLGDCGC